MAWVFRVSRCKAPPWAAVIKKAAERAASASGNATTASLFTCAMTASTAATASAEALRAKKPPKRATLGVPAEAGTGWPDNTA